MPPIRCEVEWSGCKQMEGVPAGTAASTGGVGSGIHPGIDEEATKVGYEIPLNRHFCKYTTPRPLGEIEADIKAIERDIVKRLGEGTG